MLCQACGAANEPGTKFCEQCGSRLGSTCVGCGSRLKDNARFCGECGTPVSVSTPTADGAVPGRESAHAVAERRLVSVLFADIVGFTPFAEEQDPEHVRDVLSRYFETARSVIERHGGIVEKFIGDAVMAVWGSPLAHEDDAERAVRAGLELVSAIRGVAPDVQARAAVVSGEAAVSIDGREQALVAGDLVNTAARLQAAAAPSTLLVGESTMRAASAAVAFEPAGEHELKGKSAPVRAWRALRLIAASRGRGQSDVLEPPFVGREAELTLLKDLLDATARDGRARLVLITGPAGIGKSRLTWELEKYVDGLVETIYWHRGRSPSYGEGITFWALGEMVRRRARLAETDDPATTRERLGATVAEYVPSDEDRRWVEPALLTLLGVEPAPPGGRDVLFSAWRIFFESIAARGPTVLLFEDLHFADTGLLHFIDYLLQWSKKSPILVLALARPDLLERQPELGSATRYFNSLPLEPLSDARMTELLVGLAPGLSEATMRAIVRRADGIPLYAVETIRMLLAEGLVERVDGHFRAVADLGEPAIPDTLRSLIASRLDALPGSDRVLLQRAAVLGQTFTVEALAAVTSAVADDLAAPLAALVRREILSVQGDPRSPERGQYGFVQGLIREVAYSTLSRRERRERHLAAARYYETLGDEETAGALASHYLAAFHASEPGPEAAAVAAQARLALRGAAERAISLGAYDQAVAYLEQALSVTTDAAERGELLERAAVAADAQARHEKAETLARGAIEAYQSAGHVVPASRVAGVLGTILTNAARMSDAIAVLGSALENLGPDAAELCAGLQARLARAYMREREYEAAVTAADAALGVAEPREMLDVVAEALVAKGSALSYMGRWREGSALEEVAARIAEAAGAIDIRLRALNNLAVSITDEDPAQAARFYRECVDLARRVGRRGFLGHAVPNLAFLSLMAGRDWDGALSMLDDVLGEVSSPLEQFRLTATATTFRMARGEVVEADLERLEGLLTDTDDLFLRFWMDLLRAELALLHNRLDAARRSAHDALGRDVNSGSLIFAQRVELWRGDVVATRDVGQLVDGYASTGRNITALRAWSRAGVAALEGRRADAVRGFDEAIGLWTETDFAFEAARATIDALRVVGDEPQIRSLASRAEEVFGRVGARSYVERLNGALRAAAGTTAAKENVSVSPAVRPSLGADVAS